MATTQQVTIGADTYKKVFLNDPFGGSFEYFVKREAKDGKATWGRLNPQVHRYAISRVNSALSQNLAA